MSQILVADSDKDSATWGDINFLATYALRAILTRRGLIRPPFNPDQWLAKNCAQYTAGKYWIWIMDGQRYSQPADGFPPARIKRNAQYWAYIRIAQDRTLHILEQGGVLCS